MNSGPLCEKCKKNKATISWRGGFPHWSRFCWDCMSDEDRRKAEVVHEAKP